MKLKSLFLFIIFSTISISLWADEETASKSPSVGPDKAVLEASPEKGIKLSDKAKTTLGVQTQRISKNLSVPHAALIFERNEIGIYVKHGDFYKYLEVEVKNTTSPQSTIESPKVKEGDDVVIEGAALLRLAEINVFSSNAGGDND